MKTPLRRYMNSIMDADGTRIANVLGVRTADELIHASNCHNELVNALEQARAALPDAWAAVKCKVPVDVLDLVDAAISNAKSQGKIVNASQDEGLLPPVPTLDEVASQRDAAIKALANLLLQAGNPNTIAAMEAREVVKVNDTDTYRLLTKAY